MNPIYYITQGENHREQIRHLQTALDAGIQTIQLRYKTQDISDYLRLAEIATKYVRNFPEVTWIINDNPKVAKEVQADGLHLGMQDISVPKAREIFSSGIIGGSTNTLEDIDLRISEGCHYIGLGPFRFTKTKDNLNPIVALDLYKKAIEHIKRNEKNLPLYAIGGILPEDLPMLKKIGVNGVAISSYLSQGKQTEKNYQRLLNFWNKTEQIL